MTRKHFQALADLVKDHTGANGYMVSDVFAEALADYLAEQNNNFKRDLFLKACGINKE